MLLSSFLSSPSSAAILPPILLVTTAAAVVVVPGPDLDLLVVQLGDLHHHLRVPVHVAATLPTTATAAALPTATIAPRAWST